MSGIDKVECWYDIHYTDNSTEIPPKGHKLSTPDITLEGPFNPSKNREFSEIRLELPFAQAINISYLRLTYSFNNGDDQVFYAWVDDVKLMSDSENAPMVNVIYHIDLWRSYNQFFTYGSGYVVRRPSTDNDYWQNFPYRYVEQTNAINLLPKENPNLNWWGLIAFQRKENIDGRDVTCVCWGAFPINGGWIREYRSEGENVKEVTYLEPDIGDLLLGKFDESMKISPEAITGAWLCPIKPFPEQIIGTGSRDDPYRFKDMTGWGWFARTEDEVERGWFEFNSRNPTADLSIYFNSYDISLNVTSSETEIYNLTGPLGEVIGSLPFAKHVDNGKAQLTCSSTTAYIRMTFGAYSEGLVFDYVLPAVDVNSNAWSDYVYSGQRDYDIGMRDIQSKSSLINSLMGGVGMAALAGGIANAGTAGGLGSVFEQGIMKGLTKAVPALMGGPAGAIAGAIAVGSSLIGPLLDITTFNAQFQEQEDKLHANQTPTILKAGDAYLVSRTDGQIHLSCLLLDKSSMDAINANKAVQGVKFGQNMEDCNDLINAGGPMQITNLIVHGNTPVVAKQWVQNKFAKGVRIVER